MYICLAPYRVLNLAEENASLLYMSEVLKIQADAPFLHESGIERDEGPLPRDISNQPQFERHYSLLATIGGNGSQEVGVLDCPRNR